MVYVLPETDRFCKVQVLDAWTNTVAVRPCRSLCDHALQLERRPAGGM